MQAARSISEFSRPSLVNIALRGSDKEFYEMLSRELWFSASKFVVRVVGFEVENEIVGKERNLSHDAVLFLILVEVCDRTSSTVASRVERRSFKEIRNFHISLVCTIPL